MKLMKPLKKGDLIAYIASSSPAEQDRAQACFATMEREGYRVKVMPNAWGRDGMFANTDELRAKDLRDAIEDPEVRMIVNIRGGYGAGRITPMVPWNQLVSAGKLLCGFSDTTAFHLAIQAQGGVSLHGPDALAFSRERPAWMWESFHNALVGGDPFVPSAPAAEPLVSGKAKGRLVGGCLTLICDAIGTNREIDCNGAIVALEDVGERPHRIDAMLVHLLQACDLGRAAGILIGAMSGIDEKREDDLDPTWLEIVRGLLGSLGVPVMVRAPFGHVPAYLTLPLGAEVEMDADAGRLRLAKPYLEG